MRIAALKLSGGIVVPGAEIELTFARAGGPGGQNVNKTESKVVLRFAPLNSQAFSLEERERLRTQLASRLTTTGEIVLHASTHKERERNIEEVRERLARILEIGLARARTRVETKPTRGSRKRRVEDKRRTGDTKRLRSKGSGKNGDE